MGHGMPVEPSEPEPRAGATWSHKGVRYELPAGLGLGDRVRIVLEGQLCGQSMHEYGCSVDLKPESVQVEKLAGATDAAVKKIQRRYQGGDKE